MTSISLVRRGVLLLVVAILGYLSYAHWFRASQVKPASAKRAVVTLATVQEGEISDPLQLTGVLQANHSVALMPEVSGRITFVLSDKPVDVRKGERIIGLDDAHQQAAVAESEAYLHNEQRKLKDMERLATKGVVTADQLQGQASSVAQAKARYDMVLYELGQRHLDAPFAGRISLHELSPGTWVNAGQQLLHLDDLSFMRLDLAVPERFFGQLKVGDRLSATSIARAGERFTGHIEALDSRIDNEAGSFKVRILFDNKAGQLLAGMLMQVDLAVNGARYPLVPAQAIEYRGEERFVYRVDAAGKAHRVKVELGNGLGDAVSVISGLKAGEKIVVSGLVQLKDGQKVVEVGHKKVAP